jgi:hypothetical protein
VQQESGGSCESSTRMEEYVCSRRRVGDLCVHQNESEGFVYAVQSEWGMVSESARVWGICVCSKNSVGYY